MQVSEDQFAKIVKETKSVILSAIRTNLYEYYAYAVDDVVQETYLRAYKSLIKDKFQNKSTLVTWLYAIARNEALRMNSKLKNEERKRDGLSLFLKNVSYPESGMNDKYDFNEIMKIIGLLPIKYRSIVMMHYEGVNDIEIAEKLLIPQGTVKSRLHRGKKMICSLINKKEVSK